jgi:hypothetical protein
MRYQLLAAITFRRLGTFCWYTNRRTVPLARRSGKTVEWLLTGKDGM